MAWQRKIAWYDEGMDKHRNADAQNRSQRALSRREFLGRGLALGAGLVLGGSLLSFLSSCLRTGEPPPSSPPSTSALPTSQPSSSTPSTAKLVVLRGPIPSALVEAALAGLGGLERFVKQGADVIVHPNICVAYRSFEYAATTNPEVVGTLVRLCLKAGAKRVWVMDSPFGGTPEEAYEISGIGAAVRAAGGEMEFMHPAKFAEAEIPDGRDITSWPIYQDALNADVLINVPIAKHHNLGRLSLGMKNLMGLIQDRGDSTPTWVSASQTWPRACVRCRRWWRRCGSCAITDLPVETCATCNRPTP